MNKNAGKYLAAAIAMLMIVCAVAVVAMPSEADAATVPELETPSFADDAKATSLDGLTTALEKYDAVAVTGPITISGGQPFELKEGKSLYIIDSGKVTVNGGNLTIDGTVYNQVGTSDANSGIAYQSGTITVNGIIYSVSAVNTTGILTQSPVINAYFTSIDDAVEGATGYQHIYGGDLATVAGYAVDNEYTSGLSGKYVMAYGTQEITGTVNMAGVGLVVGSTGLNSTLTIAEDAVVIASSFTAQSGSTITYNGLAFDLPEGASASYANNTMTISGTLVAAAADDDCEDGKFSGIFTDRAAGYAFIQINGLQNVIGENTVTIKQTNNALEEVYTGNHQDNIHEVVDGTWYKFDSYTADEVDQGYAFLVPKSGNVTVEVGETTYTFNFSGVTNAAEFDAPAATEVADAFRAGNTLVTLNGVANNAIYDVPANATLVINNVTANQTFSISTTVVGETAPQSVEISGANISSMTVNQGSVTLKDVVIDYDINASQKPVITVDANTNLKFTGKISVTGDLTIDATASNAVVDVLRSAEITLVEYKNAAGATVQSTITFVGGEVNIKGSILGGEIIAGNGSTVTIDGTVTSDISNTGGTIINNSATAGTITLSDGSIVDNRTSVNGSISQEIIVSGEVTVVAGGHITVNGLLTIQEGATLVLEQGATLEINASGNVVNNGTISVEAEADNDDMIFTYAGSSMAINGTLNLEGKNAFKSTGKGITVSGDMNVGDDATADIDGLVVAAGGELNVNGEIAGEFTNNGTVTIDSEVAPKTTLTDGKNVKIFMRDGAVLNLVNADGEYTVTDAGMKFRNSDGKDVSIADDKDASVTFTDVSGVTVTESLIVKMEPAGSTNATRVGYGNMAISGAADVASTLATTANTGATIAITDGTVNVAAETELTLAENVNMTIAGTLAVAGSVDATDDKAGITGANLTVTGTVTSDVELDQITNILAAVYESGTGSSKVFTYTTLAAAIAAGADDIELLGAYVIDEDITIPAGVEVDANTADERVLIKEDVTVTVAFDAAANSSGKFTNGTVVIDVDGTLITEHLKKSNVKENAVESDVTTKNGDYAKFTSIYNALAEAQPGDVVTVTTTEKITIKKDITIPAGVTLSVPYADIDVDKGVTVTVDGTYEGDTKYTMLPGAEDDPTQTIVNGMFKLLGSTSQYTTTANNVNLIAGAYYSYDGYYVISPLSVLATVMADVDGESAMVYGTVTEGDVALTSEDFTLYVMDKAVLTLSSLALDGVDFDFQNGRTSATVTVADGTFVLDKVKGGIITTVSETKNDVTTVTAVLRGTLTDAPAITTTEKVDGSVTVSGTAQIGLTGVAATNVAVETEIAAEASVAAVNAGFAGKVTVTGTLTVESANVTFGTIEVSGIVSVAKDCSATADKMYVGVTQVDSTGADDGIVTDLGSGAVSGVELDAVASPSVDTNVVYVSPNATFTPVEDQAADGTDALVSTEYYIEDALFVTAYANNGNEVRIDDVKATITNAYFAGWANEDNQFAFVDNGNKADTIRHVGEDNFEQVYADIEYDIYVINLRADQNAVSSISIDGNIMQFGMIWDTTVADGYYYGYTAVVAAGSHTISYQLANGYSGNGVLTVNGTQQSGLTFTTEGTPEVGKQTISYNLQLTGFEKSGYVPDSPDTGSDSGDSGMTITDYLLIVLVVLIIVMAIIVAMRLMRS